MATTTIRRRRRGPKAGTTAIPFLITVLISMFLFGGVALYFYNKLTAKNNELQPMQSAVNGISDSDINTILFVLDPDEPDRKNAVMMLRFDPVRKNIFCIGIPIDLQVVYQGKGMTIDTCYVNHGMEATKSAVAELMDQPIDRYIQLNSDGFQKLVNIIGNVTYRIPVRDQGLKPSDAEVTLDNSQFETMLTSLNYSNEEERGNVIGTSVSQLLNQCIGGEEYAHTRGETDGGARIARNLDGYFSSVINAVNTDITMKDFTDHRHAIRYVFEYAQAPARGMGVICDTAEDGTVKPNPVYLENLKITLFEVAVTGNGSAIPTDSNAENSGAAAGSTTVPAASAPAATLPAEQPAQTEQP
ncbi:MAG: LCP family protein [Oscillospiraceae bacterium]|nr:LCP family protein [Oscillospiraceae bacterium]